MHAPQTRSPLAWRTKLQQGQALKFLLIFLGVGAGLLAVYLWIVLSWSYSNGERAGYVQKLSYKGWLCKTWEGELALVNLPGQQAQIFNFSVRSEDVARRINDLIGQRVALVYEEHLGIPSNCFGETSYFVTDVHQVPGSPGTPNPP